MSLPLSFEDLTAQNNGASVPLDAVPGPERPASPYPDPIIRISDERKQVLTAWLDEWLMHLVNDQKAKLDEWASYEEAYRALSQSKKSFPFEGACTDVVPAIASAVDPVHSRLDTGIFKQDPVFSLKGLKKSILNFIPALEQWVDFYQKHKLKLRQVASPRILECAKLGTMVFKTVYERNEAEVVGYSTDWKVVKKKELRFAGPKVYGISLSDFLFPASYQHLQDCPIVAERQRTTYSVLKVAEASGRLKDVDKLKNLEQHDRTALETQRELSSNHASSRRADDLTVYEVWFDYDIDDDGLPEHLVATYHYESQTFLQLRYNWYFHQRKPYTVIPYTVANDTLYGVGIAEMSMPFQKSLTRWHQMASDNAYLANIRMFIVKKDSGIEEVPRLYSGRCFFVGDPKNDFLPFSAGDTYPSTLQERQNLFGLLEKRTGISDYLTGRESPIIGSRATATSTLALIQEGTKRVEEVLENLRNGFGEIIENCFYIWIQYGADGLDDLVFGDDEIGTKVKAFFDTYTEANVNGAIAIDLTATDAQASRQIQQQLKLSIIQVMMQYQEKVLELGSVALQAEMTMPAFTDMAAEVMTAARAMFKDLLNTYDIRNPEDYLPDLEKYLNVGAPAGPVSGGGVAGPTSGAGASPGLPMVPQPSPPPPPTGSSVARGLDPRLVQPITGAGQGI